MPRNAVSIFIRRLAKSSTSCSPRRARRRPRRSSTSPASWESTTDTPRLIRCSNLLQPRLLRGNAALPGLDELSMPQRHGDIVEAFEQGLTFAGIDLEDDLRAVRTGDRPVGEVDL